MFPHTYTHYFCVNIIKFSEAIVYKNLLNIIVIIIISVIMSVYKAA